MNKLNIIYNIDCIKGMKELVEDDSIDLIISDYPFNCQDGRKDYVSFIKETVVEYYRILKEGGNLLVINNPFNIFKTLSFYSEFNLRSWVSLIRPAAFFPAWHLGMKHNHALLLYKGSAKIKWNGNTINHNKSDEDVIFYKNGYRKGKFWHPQAIEYPLCNKFIERLSNENDIVLDSFVGSGNFIVASKSNNRNYIGFEINKNYFTYANERMIEIF